MLRVTKTETGMVQGYAGTDARITVFKGIPFADDTSGKNRWRAPQPAKKWEGVRKCYEFAPITMQKTPGLNPDAFYSKEWHVDPEVPMSEDGSLALNIWTPAKTGDEKLPVMVWTFGGGLSEGYCYEMEFDGERIASRGVILVSVAYRVNVFGFMAHPELTAEAPDAPTNFGFLDQQAGIKWVKRNIANFGGDPENITIFGQSAGGDSILTQLCSPTSKGVFQKAIVESAGGIPQIYPKTGSKYRTLAEAEAEGVKFLELLGVKTIAEARELDAQFIEQKCIEMNQGLWRGAIDGHFITEQVEDSVYSGRILDVPIMTGTTNHEGFGGGPKSDGETGQWAKEIFGDKADEYVALAQKRADAKGISLAEAAAINFPELGAHMLADTLSKLGRPAYYYLFAPEMPGDDAGAFHSSNLWFEFENIMKSWRPFVGKHYDLSRKMCNYWTNFARSGDPNGNDADGTPMAKWEKFDSDTTPYMGFFDDTVPGHDLLDDKQKFLVKINAR